VREEETRKQKRTEIPGAMKREHVGGYGFLIDVFQSQDHGQRHVEIPAKLGAKAQSRLLQRKEYW